VLKVEDATLSAVQTSINRITDPETSHILASQAVTTPNRTGQKEFPVILLTEFNLSFYNAKGFGKAVKLTHVFSWDQLVFISCQSDLMTAQLQFAQISIDFVAPNGMDMIATIFQHLRTIFTLSEFPREAIGVEDQYLEGYEPKKDAVVRRLRFEAFIAKRPLPPGLEQEILDRINSHRAAEKDNIPESFDFTPFLPYYDQMDLILDAIMVMPKVLRLIVPRRRWRNRCGRSFRVFLQRTKRFRLSRRKSRLTRASVIL
jgi:hypothetical protein